jgi:predicted  nucleic acid-binding Zn-ribbon protein
MKQLIRLAAISGLAALTGIAAFGAPAQQTQAMRVGDTITVNVPGEGPEGAVTVTLTVAEAAPVTLAATATDETDPVFLVRDSFGRDLVTINDNPASEAAVGELDAVLDNTLLIPGEYTILVGRNSPAGSGTVTFSVTPGQSGVIGVGEFQFIPVTLGANERYEQPIQLQEGALVSLGAMSHRADFDLRLVLRGPDGTALARNDDNETFDIFLSDFDPRIYQFRAPASGEYMLVVRSFNADQSGEFDLVIQHHGVLSGESTSEVLTGESAARARNVFNVPFEAGEIVRITARALNASLDPEIDLLTPDLIFVATNDDHGTEATDLGRFDARIEQIVIEQSGTYELDINSVSGSGPFEVVIERQGRFTEGGFTPVPAGTGTIVTPAPTIVPEVTAEPTSND